MKHLKKFEMFAQPGEDEDIGLDILDAIKDLFKNDKNLNHFYAVNDGYRVPLGERSNIVNCYIRKRTITYPDYSYDISLESDVLDLSENLKEKIWNLVSDKFKEINDELLKKRKETSRDKLSISRREADKFNMFPKTSPGEIDDDLILDLD